MKNYEIMFIVKPLEEEATNAVITKFETLITANGGTVEKIDRWGKRRLAYEVKDFIDGFYVLMHFASAPTVIAELDRVMKITEDVIKHMIIRKEE